MVQQSSVLFFKLKRKKLITHIMLRAKQKGFCLVVRPILFWLTKTTKAPHLIFCGAFSQHKVM
jgi:hypothetical protein